MWIGIGPLEGVEVDWGNGRRLARKLGKPTVKRGRPICLRKA